MHLRDLSPGGWYNVCDTYTYPIALEGEFTGIPRGTEAIDNILEYRAAARRSGPPTRRGYKAKRPRHTRVGYQTLELDWDDRLVTPVVLNTASRKLHIADPDEKPHYLTLGCRWGFGGHLAAETIRSAEELALYTVIKCKTCFRNYQHPPGWLTANTPVQSDGSDLSSCGSSIDEESETDNDASSDKRQRGGRSQTEDGRSSA